jgi:membrane protein
MCAERAPRKAGRTAPAGGPRTARRTARVARGRSAPNDQSVSAAATVIARVRTFFGARIWGAHLAALPRGRAAAYRASRLAYSTVRGFFENQLMLRAAALTYYTVLSVVPLLAFAFAVLKGFGAYRSFIDGVVRPYVQETFAANPALHGAIEKTLQFVDQTDVSRLGTVAVVFLLYTSVTLISSVEEALNDLFGAKAQRSFLRQLTDYTTLLVTAPLLLVVATTVSTAAQSSSFVSFLRDTLALGPVIDFVMGATPLLAVAVALFAIYVILPNVRIRVSAAVLGAAVAALLWQGALVLHVRLQVGVARYNALYSGLAALPIFLVWTYVSWTVVLVGAQLAASWQNDEIVRQRFRMRHADQAVKEMLAVALGAVITRDFLAGGPRRGAAALAELLEVPPQAVDEVLGDLCRAGLVIRTAAGHEAGWVPGGDVDALRAEDLRGALRRHPDARAMRETLGRALGPGARRVLREVEAGRSGVGGGLTLRDLAALLDDGELAPASPGLGSPPPAAGRNGDGDGGDPKQPDLPS